MNNFLPLVVKHLRTSKGMAQERTGEAIHASGSLIAMIETGRRIPHPDIAKRLDGLFGSGDLIVTMSAESRKDHQPGWLRPLSDVEREATSLRYHEHAVIPGLLQTEAYARAVLNSGLLTPAQAEDHVAIRLERQAVVFESQDPPVATFVIDETALGRGDSEIIRGQLQHLIKMSEQPRVYIHVIPSTTGLHLGLSGPFVLAATDDGETVGFVDDQLQGRLIADSVQVAALERVWQAVTSVALPRDLSRDLILRLVEEV